MGFNASLRTLRLSSNGGRTVASIIASSYGGAGSSRRMLKWYIRNGFNVSSVNNIVIATQQATPTSTVNTDTNNNTVNTDTNNNTVNNDTPIAPSITNFSISSQTIGASPVTITQPTSNSSGSFSYTSSNTSVATISGNILTVVGVGNSDITATQAASGNYTSGTIKTTFFVNQPSQLFTLSSNATSQLINGYYLLTFTDTTKTNSVQFNTNISNVSMLAVGGGGGGHLGKSTDTSPVEGGGGAGGGSYLLNTNVAYNSNYTINVGTGGLGGTSSITQTAGGATNIITNGTTILNCTGGGAGTTSGNSAAGEVTIPVSGTGSGGYGGGVNTNGNSSELTFTIPSALSSVLTSKYGGGGGGGYITSNGGTSGNNGIGGKNISNSGKAGQSATTYGSGGGGAGNKGPLSPGSSAETFNGGNGHQGVVYMFFPWPQ